METKVTSGDPPQKATFGWVEKKNPHLFVRCRDYNDSYLQQHLVKPYCFPLAFMMTTFASLTEMVEVCCSLGG